MNLYDSQDIKPGLYWMKMPDVEDVPDNYQLVGVDDDGDVWYMGSAMQDNLKRLTDSRFIGPIPEPVLGTNVDIFA